MLSTVSALLLLLLDVVASQQHVLYTTTDTDYQFKKRFVYSQFPVTSRIRCAFSCLEQERCGSFTVDEHMECRLSFLYVQPDVPRSWMFDSHPGVKVHMKPPDSAPPSADHVLITEHAVFMLEPAHHTWYSAYDLCPAVYGDGVLLASIDSEDEQNAVAAWLDTLVTNNYVWLAGSDENHEKCWVWAVPGLPEPSYTAWANQQPNYRWSVNHCLRMKSTDQFKWYNGKCSLMGLVLCKGADTYEAGQRPALDAVHDPDTQCAAPAEDPATDDYYYDYNYP